MIKYIIISFFNFISLLFINFFLLEIYYLPLYYYYYYYYNFINLFIYVYILFNLNNL